MPKTRAVMRELDRRVGATFGLPEDGEPDPTHLDYVCLWVESGKTLLELTRQLEAATGETLHVAMLGNYLRRHWSDATERLDEARTRGADILAERSFEVTEGRADTTADVGRMRAQSAAMQWLAGGWNRKRYGQGSRADVAVQVNVGSLHLDALRARSIPATATIADATIHTSTNRVEPTRSEAPRALSAAEAVREDASSLL